MKQTEITMNILKTTITNPRLTAYAQFFGTFNFNKTPMERPGTKVITHEKPNQKSTQRKHRVSGCYIGPALEHYRCYNCFVTETGPERIAEIV